MAESKIKRDLTAAPVEVFQTAAQQWRNYRDAECRAVFEASDGGSIAGSALLACKIEITEARRRFVQRAYAIP